MRPLFWTVLFSAIMAMVGCVTPHGGAMAESSVPIKTLYHSAFGSVSATMPQAAWIGTPEALANHWKDLHRHRPGASVPPAPAVDWENAGALLILMGRKPTGGYRLELARPKAHVEKGRAMVHLNWIEPAPYAITTQAITSPCLLLQINRGEYKSLVILDQNDQPRARVSFQ